MDRFDFLRTLPFLSTAPPPAARAGDGAPSVSVGGRLFGVHKLLECSLACCFQVHGRFCFFHDGVVPAAVLRDDQRVGGGSGAGAGAGGGTPDAHPGRLDPGVLAFELVALSDDFSRKGGASAVDEASGAVANGRIDEGGGGAEPGNSDSVLGLAVAFDGAWFVLDHSQLTSVVFTPVAHSSSPACVQMMFGSVALRFWVAGDAASADDAEQLRSAAETISSALPPSCLPIGSKFADTASVSTSSVHTAAEGLPLVLTEWLDCVEAAGSVGNANPKALVEGLGDAVSSFSRCRRATLQLFENREHQRAIQMAHDSDAAVDAEMGRLFPTRVVARGGAGERSAAELQRLADEADVADRALLFTEAFAHLCPASAPIDVSGALDASRREGGAPIEAGGDASMEG